MSNSRLKEVPDAFILQGVKNISALLSGLDQVMRTKDAQVM